ncbi:MAG: bifunctional precorrin-2 dehydrogenase/sirohydrochlorin ferrochelatase [Oscillospiraceae bacterium]|nr:bifunctional precorrin-2 dehydrogenase/sirohydrochlorin ferrochelatase [Oscillospiraceae bacterium]
MALFPIWIDWQGVPCLIAGGGSLARRKAELLCAQGADVTVAAPEICSELRALPVTVLCRTVRAEDVEGRFLVVDATGDAEAEALLRDACRAGHIPFNSACRGEDTTALFPAVHRQGRTVLAVSSTGASPAASAWLRDRLAEHIPERMDEILAILARLRPLSREYFDDQPTRRRFLRRCLDAMLVKGEPLAPEEIEDLRQAIQTERESIKEEQER